MPYKPGTIDRESTPEWHHRMIWPGAACSLVNLANAFIGSDGILFAWAMGGAIGGIVAGGFGYRADDYFRALADVGLRWAGAFVGAYLMVAWTLDTLDIAYSAGYSGAQGLANAPQDRTAAFLTDARTLAALTVAVFYAGYAFAWLRDHWGAEAAE